MNTTVDRFANAPNLPFLSGRGWFQSARNVLLANKLLIPFWALVVLAFRWMLDFSDGGVIIFLSYFTDALLFTWLFMEIESRKADGKRPWLLKNGWQALEGRRWAVMKAGWWGIPAALCSFLLFSVGPQYIKDLVAIFGSSTLGVSGMALLMMAGGYLTFLAMLWPVLAAVQIARDPQSTFKSSGLWAFRALHAGWRPLLVVFVSFIVACFFGGVVFVEAFGHLPAQFFSMGETDLFWWRYWLAWPGLLVAMTLFLALLHPMVTELLRAADVDLSDEILDESGKEAVGSDFVARALERAGFVLRSMAALSFVLLVLQALTESSVVERFGLVIFAYLWGGSFYSSAKGWRENKGKTARYRWLWMLPVWFLVLDIIENMLP